MMSAHVPLALAACVAALVGCGARSSIATSRDDAAPCPGAPASPTTLAVLGRSEAYSGALVVASPHAYWGFTAANAAGSQGVVRVPLAGGTAELFSADYDYGPLATDGAALYLARLVPVSPGVSAHLAVEAVPLGGSASTILPRPPGAAASYAAVNDVGSAPGGPTYWLLADPGYPGLGTLLVRWDGQSATATVIPAWSVALAISGDVIFVQAVHGLYRAPRGGEATWARALTPSSALLAANDVAVFYTPDGAVIVRRDATTGAETTLATGRTLERARTTQRAAAWASAAWLYFAEGGQLHRVPTDGGNVQAVWSDSRAVVEAISGSGCAVYWVVNRSAPLDPALFAVRQ
jgi:hypothetical protein